MGEEEKNSYSFLNYEIVFLTQYLYALGQIIRLAYTYKIECISVQYDYICRSA